VIAIAPNDPEAYYTTVGFRGLGAGIQECDGRFLPPMDLPMWAMEIRKRARGACEKLKAANADLVNEGLQYLHKAVELNPTYDDAMQYLQLTYRRKADLECGDEAARKGRYGSG